ncbi:MAG: PKD-like family lipoprotein, partial [Prevotella sp.]
MNRLKKYLLLTAVCSLSLTSCYDDEGGNDYDTALPDVSITIPETAYSGSLGDTITIDPIITTDIDEDDLEYHWEVKGARTNSYERRIFVSLVDSDKQARQLSYVCHLDSNITNLSTSYSCRLRIHQISTGRDFYPDENFTITIEGITGLLVLYGDDSQCDVGLLEADEFMPETSSLPDEPKVTMSLYSSAAGQQLSGKGKSIVQVVPSWVSSSRQDNCRICVMTDQEAVWLNRNDLSEWGTWDDAFYIQGENKQNDNDPRGLVVQDMYTYAFDGDEMFATESGQIFQFLLPTFSPDIQGADGNAYTMAPDALYFNSGSGIQVLYYANAVNGDTSINGFVGSSAYLDGTRDDARLLDTETDQVAFNPGNLNASLVKMSADSRGHVLAVLKGSDANTTYPGQYFFVDMLPTATAGGNSSYQNIPQFISSLATQPSVSDALFFEFGSTINMCYYATSNAVYRYGIDNNTLSTASSLIMTDGSSIDFSGDITMMKMLASPNVTTHYDDEVMLVATWDGSESHLYTLYLDTMTGNVKKKVVYDSDTVEGWNFG